MKMIKSIFQIVSIAMMVLATGNLQADTRLIPAAHLASGKNAVAQKLRGLKEGESVVCAKPQNEGSGAKMTEADVKRSKCVPNPIYPAFTNALAELTKTFADLAKGGDVVLTNGNGFVLSVKDRKPFLKFPEAYTRVSIGGLAIGDELKDGRFSISKSKKDDSYGVKMDTGKTLKDGTFVASKVKSSKVGIDWISMTKHERLNKPQLYCTHVAYSAHPLTRQIVSIHMDGDLNIGGALRLDDIINEIADQMRESYGAVDQGVDTPANMLALKKFKIGGRMDVVVKVRKKVRKCGDSDARIEISFCTKELTEECIRLEEMLGVATDKARVNTYICTGINYFTVNPEVLVDEVERKEVFR